MANWQHCPAVEQDTEPHGRLWVFKGTDVPLYRLYEHLASGGTVGSFAEQHGVDARQAAYVLEYEAEDFRSDLLIRPDGAGEIAPIPAIEPTGDEIPDWGSCTVVARAAGKVSGAWVFTDSRLPLWAMYSELAAGTTIDEFVDWYYGSRAKVVAVLEHEAKALRTEIPTAHAHTA